MIARRRRTGTRSAGALAVSLAMHLGVVGALVAVERAPEPPQPRVKVYAVNIVSPPPNVAGELPAEPPASSAPPAPAPPTPEPPAPDPPAPEPTPPTPPEPKPEPPKEPARTPAPTRAPERPRPDRTSEERTPPASRTRTERTPPATESRPRTTEKGRTDPTSRTSSSSNSATRSAGDGRRPGAATGRNPDASSPGGVGMNVRSPGEPCPSEGYCNNVSLQIRRFFRPPAGSAGGRGDVCFRILDDGSVDDVRAERVRGSAAFRLALMEAAEQAGLRKAFGRLPSAFGGDSFSVCVEMSPETR